MTQDQVRDRTTRNVGLVFVSALITQGSLLVLYLILARILTVEEFATFRQLFLIQSILNGIFFAALPTCLLYFTGCADSDGEKKAYLRVVVILTMTISFFLTLTLLLASDNISKLFNNDQLQTVLPYFSLSPLGILMIALMPACHIVTNRTAIQPYLAALIAVFVALPPIFIALKGAGLVEIVQLIAGLYFFVGLALCVLMFTIYSAGMDLNLNLRLKLKAVFLYSWPLLMASALSIVGLKADHVIVASLLGTLTYALYSVGAFEIPVFNLLQNSVTSVLMPKITELLKANDFEQATNLWRRAAAKTAAVTFPLAVLLMINADLVVKALFGVRYVDATTVFVLFNSFVFLRVITFGLALRAMDKTHIELMLTLIYLLFSVVGSYFMASYYGIEGAAIWVIVNTIILSLALSFYTLRVSGGRLSLWRIYPVRHFTVGLTLFFLVRFLQGINLLSFSYPLMVSAFYSILVILVWLGFLRFMIREDIT
jgi:O-antigen/teichoic acid export membrane protein